MATLSRAENGVVTSQAFDEAPALNAPLSGPAFIDPVFTAKTDDADEEEVAAVDPKEDLDMPGESARRWTLKDASKETLLDCVASPAGDIAIVEP